MVKCHLDFIAKINKKEFRKKKADTVDKVTKYIKEIFLKIPEIASLMKKTSLVRNKR